MLRRQRQADRSARSALQRPVDRARISHKVRPGVWVSPEELVRQHVALHPVAGRAGRDEVARRVRAAPGYRIDVVERRFDRVKSMSAVDTPPAAVPHRSTLEGALDVTGRP